MSNSHFETTIVVNDIAPTKCPTDTDKSVMAAAHCMFYYKAANRSGMPENCLISVRGVGTFKNLERLGIADWGFVIEFCYLFVGTFVFLAS